VDKTVEGMEDAIGVGLCMAVGLELVYFLNAERLTAVFV
jgi:hypothetical protein